MKLFIQSSIVLAIAVVTFAAESKVKLENLPASVQATVRQETQNATLVGISKEISKGKTMYEVETKLNGKTRDLMLDAAGKVASVEEEVDISTLPSAAREAIQKKAAGGTIQRVEKLRGRCLAASANEVASGREESL